MDTQPSPYSGDGRGRKHRPEHQTDGYLKTPEPDWLQLITSGNFTQRQARRAFLRGPKLREGINLVLIPAA